MNISKYNVYIKDFPVTGNGLIYNTLRHSFTMTDARVMDLMENCGEKPLDAGEPGIPWERFLKAGVLVPEQHDEKMLLRERFEVIKESPASLNVIIMTTFACNLACGFCIENGVKRPVLMSESTTRQVIEWLKGKIESVSPQTLSLAFYGGEPTLHLAPMKAICKQMKDICRQREITLDVGLTTNGTLLTGGMADELLEYGLNWAVIALAGEQEVHDRMRPCANGRGSFATIIRNIQDICGKIKVVIKGIYDDKNEDSLVALLDLLAKLDLTGKIHNIGFDPVIENLSATSTPAYSCGVCSYSHSNLDANLRLIKEALSRNMEANLDFSMGPCSTIMNKNHFSIDPLGQFYKCPAFAGHEEFTVGNIWDGVDDRFEYFRHSHPWEDCFDCRYVPLCGGGCRYSAYLENRDCKSVVCEKPYFERVGIDLMEINALKKLFHRVLNKSI